jgi:hypothetical protein
MAASLHISHIPCVARLGLASGELKENSFLSPSAKGSRRHSHPSAARRQGLLEPWRAPASGQPPYMSHEDSDCCFSLIQHLLSFRLTKATQLTSLRRPLHLKISQLKLPLLFQRIILAFPPPDELCIREGLIPGNNHGSSSEYLLSFLSSKATRPPSCRRDLGGFHLWLSLLVPLTPSALSSLTPHKLLVTIIFLLKTLAVVSS